MTITLLVANYRVLLNYCFSSLFIKSLIITRVQIIFLINSLLSPNTKVNQLASYSNTLDSFYCHQIPSAYAAAMLLLHHIARALWWNRTAVSRLQIMGNNRYTNKAKIATVSMYISGQLCRSGGLPPRDLFRLVAKFRNQTYESSLGYKTVHSDNCRSTISSSTQSYFKLLFQLRRQESNLRNSAYETELEPSPVHAAIQLGHRDSNPDTQNQNLMRYRYAMSQSYNLI